MTCRRCKPTQAYKITDPIYSDANKAREHLEALHWPEGPVCPHCGNCDAARITKLAGKSTRPGVRKCKDCAKPFTVAVGTIFEDTKIPLNKWLLAFRLLNGGKKGMSAHELHRSLGITYKSDWFMAHHAKAQQAILFPFTNRGQCSYHRFYLSAGLFISDSQRPRYVKYIIIRFLGRHALAPASNPRFEAARRRSARPIPSHRSSRARHGRH